MDEETPLGELLISDEIEPSEQVEASLRGQALRRVVEELPEAMRRVVKLRYGFDGHPNSINQVVKLLGISRGSVRKLEAEGLARLRRLPEVAAQREAA
jgi:RNA polymerase sigma factor (sigma-70 family)